MQEAARRRTRWQVEGANPPDDVAALAQSLGVPPIVADLLIRRGYADFDAAKAFLEPKLTALHDPAAMPGADDAACELARAVKSGRRIVIYGDYDVDGVTASAILWHTLRLAGADVHTYVPHRLDEGYGINAEAIERLAEEHTVGKKTPVIISVDCGITAVEPATTAKTLGVPLIITDHHEADGDTLPDAAVLVHPRLAYADGGWRMTHEGEGVDPTDFITPPYPCPDLCGAGVAFKVAWQFAKVHCGGERVTAQFKTLLIDLLSYVALGTVADVVPLVGENRVLTAFGLGRIKATQFFGLNAMIDAARLRDDKIDAYHVGFVIGPRLNACGRMGHAKEAVRLLTDAPQDEAIELAEFLTNENDRRRAAERAIVENAKEIVEAKGYATDDRRAIVVGSEGWHPGVIGIVASRLVEAYHRPVVMLCFGDDTELGERGVAKGSARSIDAVSIHEAFTACREHLTTFGGHAMAAGLKLEVDRVDAFREALVEHVNSQIGPEDLVKTVHVDAEVSLADCSLQAVEWLMRLAPFGRSNPTPRLAVRGVKLDRPAQRIGKSGDHLSLALRQDGCAVRAVAFGMGDMADELPGGAVIDVVFKPQISEWRGQRRPEYHVQDIQIVNA